jgi:hypothetical protein
MDHRGKPIFCTYQEFSTGMAWAYDGTAYKYFRLLGSLSLFVVLRYGIELVLWAMAHNQILVAEIVTDFYFRDLFHAVAHSA